MRLACASIWLAGLCLVAFLTGCGGGRNQDPAGDAGDAGTGSDADAGPDADTDSDTDGDADADGDSDTDIDGGPDAGDGGPDAGDGGPDWVTIVVAPSTTFTMGSPAGEPGRNMDETQHDVSLTIDFELMTHEVSQADFAKLMGYNPSFYSSCGGDCPVETVTWHEALVYANQMSAQQGLGQCFDCTGTAPDFTCALKASYAKPQDCPGYRLPTESEWEYAIRAGTTTAFFSGPITAQPSWVTCESDPNLVPIGWYCGNSSGITHPAAGKQPNAWGFYDLSGNVYEWVWDRYGAYPGTVVDPSGAQTAVNRVMRGGGVNYTAPTCRSASRGSYPPGHRYDSVGLRLARSIL
jgi:formylglycine-generating enzyme required for sulfatase activity